MKQLNIALSLLLLFSLSSVVKSPLAAEKNPDKLIFGIHPYLHASTLIERFTPLTEYLSSSLGQDIKIRVGNNYDDHIDAIKQGKVDFAFLGPALFIKLTQNNKQFSPLGRLSFSGKGSFRGAIIIRQDNPLKSISELGGKQFAFGDPSSTLSSLVPLRLLSDAGIELSDLSSYTNLKNHHNVALSVLLGKHDAGGVKEEVFREYQSRGLKVIQWSPDIPTHLFVARAGLSQQKIDHLRQLLQDLHQQSDGPAILQSIKKGTTVIIPTNIEEYDELRHLINSPPVNHQQ